MSDDVTPGPAWGGVPPIAPDQPRPRAVDGRSPMDRRALEEAMILSGQRGSDSQRAVRRGELDAYIGGVMGSFEQQFEAPIQELSGLIADPALLFRNSGLSAPEIVDALPAAGNFPGRLVFLTTDSKLYRWTGDEWTTAVPAEDVTGQITGDKIAANTITAGLLATSGVITQVAQIGDGLITNAKIADAAITRAKIGAAAIGTAQIENGAITNALIGNAAITNAKISDLQVTNAKIADLTVGGEKIQNGAITGAGIAGGGYVGSTGSWVTVAQFWLATLGGRAVVVWAVGLPVAGAVGGEGTPGTGILRILVNGVVVDQQGAAARVPLLGFGTSAAGSTHIALQVIKTNSGGPFGASGRVAAVELKK